LSSRIKPSHFSSPHVQGNLAVGGQNPCHPSLISSVAATQGLIWSFANKQITECRSIFNHVDVSCAGWIGHFVCDSVCSWLELWVDQFDIFVPDFPPNSVGRLLSTSLSCELWISSSLVMSTDSSISTLESSAFMVRP
jgi:hypothetical protein